jgi:hypothetical protein
MRWVTTPGFESQFRKMPREHRTLFREFIPAFDAACNAYAMERTPFPPALRVHKLNRDRSLLAVTWNFERPDGRGLWAWTTVPVTLAGIDGTAPAVLWHSIGTHEINKL